MAKKRTEYSAQLASNICRRLSKGESLQKICGDADMPELSTVYFWLKTNEEFQAQYIIARKHRADILSKNISKNQRPHPYDLRIFVILLVFLVVLVFGQFFLRSLGFGLQPEEFNAVIENFIYLIVILYFSLEKGE